MKETFIEVLGDGFGLPTEIRHLISGCMSDERFDRPTAQSAAEVVRRSSSLLEVTSIQDPWTPPSNEHLLQTIDAITEYILTSADLDRHDRLFPADPLVFFGNPLSIAHGAVGVAYALSSMDKPVPKSVLAWILRHPVHPRDYPPGLYVGSSGIGWALWELGLKDVALQTMDAAKDHPLTWDEADVFYGASGYGLACLRFYLGTGEQSWLDQAAQIGDWLVQSKIESRDAKHCHWTDKEGNIWLGYARGASGIGLYLLYLGLLTGQRQFLETSERAMAFVLSHARPMDEGHLSIPRGAVGSFENVVTHYWQDGTAGVAGVLARFWKYTGNVLYSDTLKRLAPDTFRKLTIFPGLFLGLAGLGNFLVDAYDFTGDKKYLEEAYRVASGVLLFSIHKPTGIAFPGEQLLRISTDFGTGSSGIALFLHRLANADQRPGDFNFTLDHLIGRHNGGIT